MPELTRVAVLTISDSASRGERIDTSGPAICEWIAKQCYTLVEHATVPDESAQIVPVLMRWADREEATLILTTGGTGLSSRDITPEATRTVIDRDAPGIAEALRSAGLRQTPRAALSRGVAGTRGSTLIINLPGSTHAVTDALATLTPLVEHITAILRGETEH